MGSNNSNNPAKMRLMTVEDLVREKGAMELRIQNFIANEMKCFAEATGIVVIDIDVEVDIEDCELLDVCTELDLS